MNNKRVEIVAKAMLSLALSSDEEGTGLNVKTLAEYRSEAAVILATADMVMFSSESITNAIVKAGYEPAECAEQFLKINKELVMMEEESTFFISDMEKAWARGHEDGFWDARQTDTAKPGPVTPTTSRIFFTEEDVKNAEAQGYLSGWHNGILSENTMSGNSDEQPLLGAEHGKATNPYSDRKASNEALRESQEGHAMWCAGNHAGDCKRGQATGTEKGSDDD